MDYDKLSDYELNLLIAEKVMGWKREDQRGAVGFRASNGKYWLSDESLGYFSNIFTPATHWRDAGAVLERMNSMGWSITVTNDHVPRWCCILRTVDAEEVVLWEATAPIPTRAICIAALKAVAAREGGER